MAPEHMKQMGQLMADMGTLMSGMPAMEGGGTMGPGRQHGPMMGAEMMKQMSGMMQRMADMQKRMSEMMGAPARSEVDRQRGE
jgi:hypothetical protein